MSRPLTRPLIRAARPEDDSIIGDILVTAYLSQYARKLPHVVIDEARKADLRNVAEKRRIGTVLAAELDGKVVGAVTVLKPGGERSEAWRENMADIRMFGIDLAYRGQGISEALLDEAERIAREDWRCQWVGLHVRRGAEGIARLYQKRGYQRDPSGDIDRMPVIFLEAYFKTLS